MEIAICLCGVSGEADISIKAQITRPGGAKGWRLPRALEPQVGVSVKRMFQTTTSKEGATVFQTQRLCEKKENIFRAESGFPEPEKLAHESSLFVLSSMCCFGSNSECRSAQ